jgi:hypothetical protein
MNIARAALVANVQAADGVSIMMLRKVLDMQQANAAQLIASVPAAPQAQAPDATLGRSVDTYA